METPNKVLNDFIASITTEPLLIDHCRRQGGKSGNKAHARPMIVRFHIPILSWPQETLEWVSELVYLTSLLNSQGLMSDRQGARQWDEWWKCPRLEYTGFRIRDPVVWSRVFYRSTKRTALSINFGINVSNYKAAMNGWKIFLLKSNKKHSAFTLLWNRQKDRWYEGQANGWQTYQLQRVYWQWITSDYCLKLWSPSPCMLSEQTSVSASVEETACLATFIRPLSQQTTSCTSVEKKWISTKKNLWTLATKQRRIP